MRQGTKIFLAWMAFLVLSTSLLAQQLPPPPPPPPPPGTSLPGSTPNSVPTPTVPNFSNSFPSPSTANPVQKNKLGKNKLNSVPSNPQSPGSSSKTGRDPLKLELTSKGLINLDFVNVDIGDMVQSISELTKRDFILDDKVHGKITIISPKPVTVEEAYQAFISALSVQNFAVVNSGRMFKIIPLRDMKNNPIPTDIEPLGGDDAFVTRLVPVKYISAAELVKSLRGFLTKNGDVVNYDPTNTLIITDQVGNLRRLTKIIDKLDKQGNQETLEVIKIQYAPCNEIVDKINQIFDLKGNRNPGAPGVTAESPSSAGQFISKILPDERTNSIIVVASQEGIRRVKEVVNSIDQALEKDASRGSIHVHYLQYADASELLGTLSSLTGGKGSSQRVGGGPSLSQNRPVFPNMGNMAPPSMPSGGVSNASLEGTDLFDGKIQMTADVPTNSLVITSTPNDYRSLIPVIQKLDMRRPQAFVEAMIMEVDINKSFEMGVAAHAGKQFDNGQAIAFGASEFGPNMNSLGPPPALPGLTFGMQGRNITLPGTDFKIPIYGALFRALQSNGTVNVLSTPNILTSDNKEAEIIVGQEVPFTSSSALDINGHPVSTITRQNVAITLRVTPRINESDDVTLNIFQKIEDINPDTTSNANGPTTTNRSAKTTVLVKDGQTVTIGGLIADIESVTESKVPVLGDIPILGWFFKSKSKDKRKTSLVIFITPHIVRTPEDLQNETIEKNQERTRFLDENNVSEHPGIKKYNLEKSLLVPEKTKFETPNPQPEKPKESN